MDSYVTLLKQKLVIEQKIRKISSANLTESKQLEANKLLLRLENQLGLVNEILESLQEDSNSDPKLPNVNAPGTPGMFRTDAPMPHVNDPGVPDMFKTDDNVKEGGKIDPSSYDQYPDHEVQMARSDLYRIAKRAIMLHEVLQRLDEKQGLEGWVQAKITKASDYIETVWEYLSYEMRFPADESVSEATYGPGDDTTTPPTAPGAPKVNAQAKQGEMSPTPTVGGSTPGGGTPGMVKMAKLDPNNKPIGLPIMVQATDIANKQKQGFRVLGEVTESASAGATGAGAIAGNATGFANGGIGMQRRKKKKFESEDPMDQEARDAYGRRAPSVKKTKEGVKEGSMADVEKEEHGPNFTGYWKGTDKGKPGKKMVGGQ